MESPPLVSVIVPVYRAEKFIQRCARSLFEQTLEEMEFVFVNDCTPDSSMVILRGDNKKEYPNRARQIRIVEHDQNKGSATARNTGLDNAHGSYIIYCDSDDWWRGKCMRR
ncbi:glycosyltransferase family 2 protein [Bacteroides thetaiotaomicron]|nr:glycosyltransferase family 2 protein [Bacteroides thetaiotaomicron]